MNKSHDIQKERVRQVSAKGGTPKKIKPGTIVTIASEGRILFTTGEGINEGLHCSKPGEEFELIDWGENSTTLKAIKHQGQPTFTLNCHSTMVG